MSLNATQTLLWKREGIPSFWLMLVSGRATRPAAFPSDCLEEYVYLMLMPPFMQDAWKARHERRKGKGKEIHLHHSKPLLLPWQRNNQKEEKTANQAGALLFVHLDKDGARKNKYQPSGGVAVHVEQWSSCATKPVLGGTHRAPCNQCHTSSAHTFSMWLEH